MANPTVGDVFGTDATSVNDFLNAIGFPAASDARFAAYRIVSRLHANLADLIETSSELETYRIDKNVQNVDVDTQVQTFTLSFRLALTASELDDEL